MTGDDRGCEGDDHPLAAGLSRFNERRCNGTFRRMSRPRAWPGVVPGCNAPRGVSAHC